MTARTDADGPRIDRGRRSSAALLLALGVDNLGSGLFLPLSLVYVTSVVGVPLSLAGSLVAAGTVLGLLAPPVAGRFVDQVGPRAVVIASQVLQGLGMLASLLARGPALVVVGAALVAAGTQTFYSSLFALIADVARAGPTDRAFARVDMVRTAAFGCGALLSALLLALASTGALRASLAVDAATCAAAAVLLAALVHPRRHTPGPSAGTTLAPARVPVWRNRPYLALIVVTGLLGVAPDLFLVGIPVYSRRELHAPPWLPGVALTLLTVLGSTLASAVVHRTRTWTRTRAMGAGAACFAAWGVAVAVGSLLPRSWSAPWVLGSTLVLAAGSLLFGTRANALAEAAAPPASRGVHLAAFQYAYTAAGLLAPLLVSLLTVAAWLPWTLVSAGAALGLLALRPLARRLPASAVRPMRSSPPPRSRLSGPITSLSSCPSCGSPWPRSTRASVISPATRPWSGHEPARPPMPEPSSSPSPRWP